MTRRYRVAAGLAAMCLSLVYIVPALIRALADFTISRVWR